MKKLAYLECPTGIAGDMCLGALVHAGVPLDYLIEKLSALGIANEYNLRVESVHRNGQLATKVHVDLLADSSYSGDALTFQRENHHSHDHEHHHSHNHEHLADRPTRHLPEIEQLITNAQLPSRAETWSLAVFRQLAEAEAAVHGVAPEQVHFHEVGATDAIVDIVGTCLGLDWLGIDELYCSALPTGGGTVRAAHGQLPVPVPAVLKLWEMHQVPVYSNGIEREMVTPTGAALAVTLASHFGPPPVMTIQRVGLGAGSRQLTIPNILRLWIGEENLEGRRIENLTNSKQLKGWPVGQLSSSQMNKLQVNHSQELPVERPHQPSNLLSFPSPSSLETICVLETQIDDLSPQVIGYVFDALFAVGAVDVFTQAIGMKKSRPGILLTVISSPEHLSACETVLFRETTTLGIRRFIQQRTVLQREIQLVQTEYGSVRVKVAWSGQNGSKTITNVQPEYEDCAQLARSNHQPWRKIHYSALDSWYRQQRDNDHEPIS